MGVEKEDKQTDLQAELKKKGLRLVDRADMDAAGNCFVLTFFACVAVIACAIKYTTLGPNSFFWMAPAYVLSGASVICICSLWRRSFRKGLRAVPLTMMPVMLATMMTGMLCGGHLVTAYANADEARTFAERDLAKYADASGTVHTAALEQVRLAQISIFDQALELKRIGERIADLNSLDAADKARFGEALKFAEDGLEKRRMPDDQYTRLITVIEAASYIGTADGADRGSGYAVSAAQLNETQAIIAQKYPHWVQLINLVSGLAAHFQ